MKSLLLCTCLVALMWRSAAENDYCDADSGCLEKLKSISPQLKDLSRQLTSDQDIQSKTDSLAIKADEVLTEFTKAISNQGNEILKQKDLLMAAVSANDVNVNGMHGALEAGRTEFRSVKNKVLKMQTDVQGTIDTTRGRRLDHENTYANKKGSLQTIQDQIIGNDEIIQTLERDAKDLDTDAATLDNRAHEIQRHGKKKKKKSIFGAIVGTVLAPFTGGLSLAVGAAYAGINVNDAGDCFRKARQIGKDASAKRQHANTLRGQGQVLANRKASLQSELEGIHEHIVKLEGAASVLADVTRSLLSYTRVFDQVFDALENMDIALSDAERQGESFKIIKNAFASKPEKLGAASEKYLEQLKNKWVNLETIFTTYGALS